VGSPYSVDPQIKMIVPSPSFRLPTQGSPLREFIMAVLLNELAPSKRVTQVAHLRAYSKGVSDCSTMS
jgi:hypothetical protein